MKTFAVELYGPLVPGSKGFHQGSWNCPYMNYRQSPIQSFAKPKDLNCHIEMIHGIFNVILQLFCAKIFFSSIL